MISVIIPIYKVEPYLKRCIESILSQTYKDLQIILVDDGSPDNCPAICDAYMKEDPRICVIHKANGGLSDARNAGLNVAEGEYIYFLDGDDYVYNNLFECILPIMGNNTDMAVFNYQKINLNNQVTSESRFHKREALFENDISRLTFMIQDFLSYQIGYEVWNKLYRRTIIEKYEIRFADNKKIFAEDIFFNLCYLSLTAKISISDKVLINYLQREDSIMGEEKNTEKFNEMVTLSKELFLYFKNHKETFYYYSNYSFIHLNILYIEINKKIRMGFSLKDIKKQCFPNIQERRFNNTQLRNLKKIKTKVENIYAYDINYTILDNRFLAGENYFIYKVRNKLLNYRNKRKLQLFIKIKFPGINKKGNHIFLIGTEDWGNLGDQQIAVSEINFIKSLYPDRKLFEIPASCFWKDIDILTKSIKINDIIILTGGGNFGNIYSNSENIRKAVADKFYENKIIIFPQTIFYSKDSDGENALLETKNVFERCKDLTICTREKESYLFAGEKFNCRIILTPDIVLSSDLTDHSCVRKNKVLFCMRSDKEKLLTVEEQKKLIEQVGSLFEESILTDTQLEYSVPVDRRSEELSRIMSEFRSSSLVVTDRLHGLIFAAVTGTPCIAFSNYNQKITGTMEWLKDINYIKFAENVAQVESLIKALKIGETGEYPLEKMRKLFAPLQELI